MNTLSSLLKNYATSWKKSFNFKGKTRRVDFWQFFGVDFLLLCLLTLLLFFGDPSVEGIGDAQFAIWSLFIALGFLPRISILIRRLRDAD